MNVNTKEMKDGYEKAKGVYVKAKEQYNENGKNGKNVDKTKEAVENAEKEFLKVGKK